MPNFLGGCSKQTKKGRYEERPKAWLLAVAAATAFFMSGFNPLSSERRMVRAASVRSPRTCDLLAKIQSREVSVLFRKIGRPNDRLTRKACGHVGC